MCPRVRFEVFFVPRVSVEVAVRIAHRPGISIPVPRSTHVRGIVDAGELQTELAERVASVDTAETGAHDQGIELCFNHDEDREY